MRPDIRGSRRPGVPLGLPVPAAEPGVCGICHAPARDGRARCWCCRAVGRALGDDAGDHPVVPAALFAAGDTLHAVLRGYKDAGTVAARRHFAGRLAAHLDGFLTAHGACIERDAGSWDAVAIVPSSTGRARSGGPRRRGAADGPHCTGDVEVRHPLTAVIDRVGALSALARVELVRGGEPVGHLAPRRRAFAAPVAARGRRVLLIDDTWVTGARMVSAAVALEVAGATVVAQLVAGRLVRPKAPARPGRVSDDTQRGTGERLSDDSARPCCLWSCPARPAVRFSGRERRPGVRLAAPSGRPPGVDQPGGRARRAPPGMPAAFVAGDGASSIARESR